MGFKRFIEEEEEEAEAAGMDPSEGQRGPEPPLGPKFFFLVCKIFQKKAWAPLVFSSGPPHLNHPYPSQPASLGVLKSPWPM